MSVLNIILKKGLIQPGKLFNYKDYVLCTAAFYWGSLTVISYIARNFPFLTLAVFVATLLVGIKFCVS